MHSTRSGPGAWSVTTSDVRRDEKCDVVLLMGPDAGTEGARFPCLANYVFDMGWHLDVRAIAAIGLLLFSWVAFAVGRCGPPPIEFLPAFCYISSRSWS